MGDFTAWSFSSFVHGGGGGAGNVADSGAAGKDCITVPGAAALRSPAELSGPSGPENWAWNADAHAIVAPLYFQFSDAGIVHDLYQFLNFVNCHGCLCLSAKRSPAGSKNQQFFAGRSQNLAARGGYQHRIFNSMPP